MSTLRAFAAAIAVFAIGCVETSAEPRAATEAKIEEEEPVTEPEPVSDRLESVDLSVDYTFPECDQSRGNVDPNVKFRCKPLVEGRARLQAHFSGGQVAHRVAVELSMYDS